MIFKNFIKNNEYRIALIVGYVLVASLAFGLGQVSVRNSKVLMQPLSNYNPNQADAQTTESSSVADSCAGRIKGSSSMLYHTPGSAFYDKTTHPIKCFDTEAEAIAAGFKKSSK